MALNSKKLPILFLSDSNSSGTISREVKTGRVRKIGPRLYTTNISDDPAYINRQNWLQALSLLMPGCVVSNRTALESRVSPAGRVYVTGEYNRALELHGTKFVQIKGHRPVEGDTPLLGMYMSSRARALLENLTPTRQRVGGELKNLSREMIERRLAELLNFCATGTSISWSGAPTSGRGALKR